MSAVVKLSVRDEEALERVKLLLEENLEAPPSIDQLPEVGT